MVYFATLEDVMGWNYSECRLNGQALPSHSVLSSLIFFLCPCFSPSASSARLVLEKWFDRAAVQFVKSSRVSELSFLFEY